MPVPTEPTQLSRAPLPRWEPSSNCWSLPDSDDDAAEKTFWNGRFGTRNSCLYDLWCAVQWCLAPSTTSSGPCAFQYWQARRTCHRTKKRRDDSISHIEAASGWDFWSLSNSALSSLFCQSPTLLTAWTSSSRTSPRKDLRDLRAFAPCPRRTFHQVTHWTWNIKCGRSIAPRFSTFPTEQ